MNNSALKCTTCGKSFAPSTAVAGEVATALIEEESVRCARLQEITQQRQALALRMQAGITGMLGSDTMDTIDMVAQRRSLNQLDATLKSEAEDLVKVMGHAP